MNMEPDLFSWQPPPPIPSYVHGSATSREAALSVRESAETVRGRVLEFIRQRQGATCSEVELGLHLPHQSASARIVELKRSGKVRASGERRATMFGRSAEVVVATV